MSSIPHTHMASVSPWSNTSPSFSSTMRSAGLILGVTVPIVFLIIGVGVHIYLRREAVKERHANQTLPRTFLPIDKPDELEPSVHTITRPSRAQSYGKLSMNPFSNSFRRQPCHSERAIQSDCHSSNSSRCLSIRSLSAFFSRKLSLSRRTSERDLECAFDTDKGVPVPTKPRTRAATKSTIPTSSRSCNLSCESHLGLPLPTVAYTRSRSVSL